MPYPTGCIGNGYSLILPELRDCDPIYCSVGARWDKLGSPGSRNGDRTNQLRYRERRRRLW